MKCGKAKPANWKRYRTKRATSSAQNKIQKKEENKKDESRKMENKKGEKRYRKLAQVAIFLRSVLAAVGRMDPTHI